MSAEMHCPYCDETERIGRIRWRVLLLALLLQGWPFYLVYCLLSGGQVCRKCGRRIYGVRGHRSEKDTEPAR